MSEEQEVDRFLMNNACLFCGEKRVVRDGMVRYSDPLQFDCKCAACKRTCRVGYDVATWAEQVSTMGFRWPLRKN